MRISDWSSDVCSSDLAPKAAGACPSAHEARCGCAGGAFRKEKDPWSSLLLPFLAEDVLAAILDALALVRLGLAPATDLGRDLTHLLLVDPRNPDRGLIGGLDLDPLGPSSEDRRVGKEGVCTCISRWAPSH